MTETMEKAAGVKRDSIIEKVKKLQRMTTERGASENEAMQAVLMAQKLITEHSLSQTELEIREDAAHCIKDTLTIFRTDREGWIAVITGIEKLYGTIGWYSRKKEDLLDLGFEIAVTEVTFYGFGVDVAGSIATLAICAQAVATAIEGLPSRTSEIKKRSFEHGMCERLRERLREMQMRGMEEAKGRGALVVLKDQLVREAFSKTGVNLRYVAQPQKKLDAGAIQQGRAAANSVQLSRGMSGSAGKQGRLA